MGTVGNLPTAHVYFDAICLWVRCAGITIQSGYYQ